VVRPRPIALKIVPWSHPRVAAMRLAMAERYKIAIVLGAGCGLRQGEMFGGQVFALPKRNKTRDVPVATSVPEFNERIAGRAGRPLGYVLGMESNVVRLRSVAVERVRLISASGQAR
jgi:hypothetical protein